MPLVKQLSELIKLPGSIVLRLNDLLIYSRLAKNPNVEKEYRICVKKRLYIRCMNSYAELFRGSKEKVCPKTGGIQAPYIYNDLLEDDQFAQKTGDQEGEIEAGLDPLTAEGMKMQLQNMFEEMGIQFESLKAKIQSYQ